MTQLSFGRQMTQTLDSYNHDSLSESDVNILEAYGYSFKIHQPWQIGFFHEDIDGKFVWYPKKGTLMREGEHAITKLGEYHDIEDVIKRMDMYLP